MKLTGLLRHEALHVDTQQIKDAAFSTTNGELYA